MMMKGDCTGPVSAEFVLKDPTVDFAVLECARGGILRAGLGFHNCDIAIITNIAADHLGLQGIDTLEQLARVKSVVAESVFREGYAILNADDDLVYKMKDNISCKLGLFSMDETNQRIVDHCAAGGLAAVYENGYLTIMKGTWKIRVEKVSKVPMTFGGRAEFNIANALPVILASFIRNFKIEDIRASLQTFIPSPAQTPGRMNLFNFKNFAVMVDYAHNTAGLMALGKFLAKTEASKKIGIIAGVGDRRDQDTISLGEEAAKIFDEVIIRQDRNLRGRSEDYIINLMVTGIKNIDPNKKITIIPLEREAIDFTIKNAEKDAFIVICSDVIPDALEQIIDLKAAEEEGFSSMN
jgi:cyanophycin synthetase